MAIARRGTPTTLAQTASATSGDIGVPTGVVDGDGLVLVVWMLGSNTLTVTSGLTGWTLKKTVTASTVVSGHIFTRVAASEPVSYTMGYASCRVIAAMSAYSGTDQTDFVVAVDGQSGGTTVHTTPSVSSVNADDWAFACFADRITSSASKNTGWTPGAGISTLLASLLSNNAAGTSPWGSMDVCDSNGAVSVGAHSYTDTSTTSTGNAMAVLVILKAAATTTPVSVPDAGSSADDVAVVADGGLTEAASSAADLAVSATMSLPDAAGAADAMAANAALGLPDSANAADALIATPAGAAKPVADAGASLETLSALAATSLAETASSSAALTASAASPTGDTGGAAQTLAVLTQAAVLDAASALDALGIAVTIALEDSGVGDDSASAATGGATSKAMADAGTATERLRTLAGRPSSGSTARPDVGTTTTRPYTGTTYR